NGAFARLSGVRREQLVGRALSDALPVAPLPGPEEPLREVSYCEPDGRERHLQLSLAACGRAADDLRYQLLRKADKQTFPAANIANALLEFARDRKQEHRTLPLAGVMRDALES